MIIEGHAGVNLAHYSPYAVRYRVGRLLFGERYAASFAAGRFGPR